MQGPKWPVILLACGPGEVILIVGTCYVPWVGLPVQRRLCPDFREWCRVTRHSLVFRGMSTDTPVLGRHSFLYARKYIIF